ncbi:hypothetical protein ACFLY2_02195 [Patescibacteria group bacterium]
MIQYTCTKNIGNNEAHAINQNPLTTGFFFLAVAATQIHIAATSGTVIVEVVTQPKS